MSDSADSIGHIVARIQELTEASPDGDQNEQSNVWTSKRRLRSDAGKTWSQFARDDVEPVVETLREKSKVVTWHGLVAPADDEHLQAVIESEEMAGITRSRLVAKCNRLRQGGAA